MKKITKFLDSVMGGIKRTCIAKAVAVFAVASIAISANAQTDDDLSGVTSFDQLVGKTETQLYAQKIIFDSDKGETKDNFAFPTNTAQHFFLYNVKTGRFLNAGGYWGTHVSLKEYGEPLVIVEGDHKLIEGTFMKLVMEMHGTEGKYVGWYGVPGDKNRDAADIGVFVDRKFDDVFGWHLEPVDDGKNKNTYKLYTYIRNSYGYWDTAKRYYLCSNKGSLDVDVNCGAFPYNEDHYCPVKVD